MNDYELNDEEKRILQKHKGFAEVAKVKENLFWEGEYPYYSIQDKVNYWLTNIHHGMRIQGEATADSYTEFSIEWYQYVKSKEVDFDFIFSQVVPLLGIDFSWREYYKRIGKVL